MERAFHRWHSRYASRVLRLGFNMFEGKSPACAQSDLIFHFVFSFLVTSGGSLGSLLGSDFMKEMDA